MLGTAESSRIRRDISRGSTLGLRRTFGKTDGDCRKGNTFGIGRSPSDWKRTSSDCRGCDHWGLADAAILEGASLGGGEGPCWTAARRSIVAVRATTFAFNVRIASSCLLSRWSRKLTKKISGRVLRIKEARIRGFLFFGVLKIFFFF